ncbi:hypothetical protein CBR_g36936 [Chara braunii]|uniref:UDP N-acetylglucosamine O-acyltransferase C-terminal domain-containing protein n=1 Tax=Chara braunii TaxID=69332 RepID=A0A388JZG3_CHABU|nr:hypothetical protein CBR_g36936 [Chara braunii]|eukprot:GBG63167.1 hypothetical protein CBR_g36936 [Chara braunii]
MGTPAHLLRVKLPPHSVSEGLSAPLICRARLDLSLQKYQLASASYPVTPQPISNKWNGNLARKVESDPQALSHELTSNKKMTAQRAVRCGALCSQLLRSRSRRSLSIPLVGEAGSVLVSQTDRGGEHATERREDESGGSRRQCQWHCGPPRRSYGGVHVFSGLSVPGRNPPFSRQGSVMAGVSTLRWETCVASSSKVLRHAGRAWAQAGTEVQVAEDLLGKQVELRGEVPACEEGIAEESEPFAAGSLLEVIDERRGGHAPGHHHGAVKVHSMAVVHPDAVLGEGVEIGPFCTVGPLVRLGPNCRMLPGSHVEGDTELGEGCVLMHGAVVGEDIPGKTILGKFNQIGRYAVVGVKCQDLKYKAGDECFLVIGDHNDIREHTSIHRSSSAGSRTEIGHKNLIMGLCHVGHDCHIGNNNIFANGTLLAGHVVFEDYVHAGGATAVHQFCHVGSYAFLAGGALVVRDVPAYIMVAGDRAEFRGLNVVGIQRAGFPEYEVRSLRRAYAKLFLNLDSRKPASLVDRLTMVEDDEELQSSKMVAAFLQSIRSSLGPDRRGICNFRASSH